MEEITGRFIQLATRPLAGNEVWREVSADELKSRLAHAGQDEGAIRDAMSRTLLPGLIAMSLLTLAAIPMLRKSECS